MPQIYLGVFPAAYTLLYLVQIHLVLRSYILVVVRRGYLGHLPLHSQQIVQVSRHLPHHAEIESRKGVACRLGGQAHSEGIKLRGL